MALGPEGTQNDEARRFPEVNAANTHPFVCTGVPYKNHVSPPDE